MKKSLNIAMVAACPLPCARGTPVRIVKTVEALTRMGHRVHVVTYHLGDARIQTYKVHRIPEVKTYRRYCAGPTYQKLMVLDPLLTAELYKVLKNHPIDLIHAHHYEGLIVALVAGRFTHHPIVFDAHTVLESELPSYSMGLSKGIKRLIGRALDNYLPKCASHTITVTDEIRAALMRNGVRGADITVIPNGVEHEIFGIPAPPHPISGNGFKKIIYTGNFAEFQRVDLLLIAFKEILNHRKDVRLLIASEFSFDPLEPLARKLGIRENIDLIRGGFDKVPEYLAHADIAANPRTVCDGLPQKILNYMAAGKPIVSFEGSAKLIEHGKTGWVVENGNIPAFSNAMIRLLENPDLAAELGRNARRTAKTEYSWEKTAERTETVYKQVLETEVLRMYRFQRSIA